MKTPVEPEDVPVVDPEAPCSNAFVAADQHLNHPQSSLAAKLSNKLARAPKRQQIASKRLNESKMVGDSLATATDDRRELLASTSKVVVERGWKI